MSGAEAILGAVSGSAGLLSLSVQLFESSQKLKAFYDAVRDAQETLDDLVFDLETMALTFRHLERHRQEDEHDDELLDRAIAQCRRCTAPIQTTVDALAMRMRKHRRMGRAYTAWKEQDISKLMLDLERAKSSLQLAVLSYHQQQQAKRDSRNAIILREHSRQLATMYAMQESTSTILVNDMRLLLASAHSTGESTVSPRITAVDDDNDAEHHGVPDQHSYSTRSGYRQLQRKHRRRPWQVTAAFPQWLTNQIWTFGVWNAQNGWDCSLRTFRVVPDRSDIWRVCRLGDIKQMQHLLSSGQASLDDVRMSFDQYETVLEVSVQG